MPVRSRRKNSILLDWVNIRYQTIYRMVGVVVVLGVAVGLLAAAAYMRVGAEDVLEVIKSGDLKAKKIGSSYRISKQAIDEFLSS